MVDEPAGDELNGEGDDLVVDETAKEEPISKKRKATAAKAKPKKKPGVGPLLVQWGDIQERDDQETLLARFPAEVLDLIISVDSDLELRDHLALAGTCRYLRGCYRDDVFQALLQAFYPDLTAPSPHLIFNLATGIPYDNFSIQAYREGSAEDSDPDIPRGPYLRSLASARHIFSHRSLVGAGGWTGWGLQPDLEEFLAHKAVTDEQKATLESVIDHHWGSMTNEWNDELEAEFRMLWRVEEDEAKNKQIRDFWVTERLAGVDAERARCKEQMREAHGLARMEQDPRIRHEYIYDEPGTEYDPWPSLFRGLVAKAVNLPTVNKTQAKKLKLTDRELLTLTERRPANFASNKNARLFSKAAVEAMALRKQSAQQ